MCVYCRLNEKKDSKYIIRKDGKYAMTEDGKKVPKICPECGAEMTLQIKGEPIYICKNDHYFGTMKFSLKEGFEFDSINKDKKAINIYDTFIYEVIEKIKNREIISLEEYGQLSSFIGIYKVDNKEALKNIVDNCIKLIDNNCNLNWIDTSDIDDMSCLFSCTSFNGDISMWDVSNVKDMHCMFTDSKFNGNISNWDVSNVKDMSYLFGNTPFNGDISSWDVSNVITMENMFSNDKNFNGDISKWDVSNVKNMQSTFFGTNFNNDISKWDVSNVTNMYLMFRHSNFNKDISTWNVSNVQDYEYIFNDCPIKDEYTPKFNIEEGFSFNSVNKNKKKLNAVDIIFWDKLNAITEKIINYDKNTILSYDEKEFMLSLDPNTYLTNDEDINPLVRNYIKIFGYDCDLNWIDTSNVTDMSYLFDEIRSFTGNVSEWNVSNVTNMGNMFGSTNFNGDISKWDVSNVTDMDSMFEFSLFNGDISNWDVSNVTDMSYMFMESQFNGDISKWDVSNVEVMTCMFYKSQFNGDISKWNISNVVNMKRMFYKSPFSGNLNNWDVKNVSNLVKIFQKTPLESNPPSWYTKKVNEWNGVLVKERDGVIKESFDFDSVNKQKKSINVYDAILTKIVLKILYKSRLSKEDRNIILSLPVASYKTNDSEIHLLIEKCIEFFGPTCNLNWIDTSNVTNMKRLFWEAEFNGDISLWNVSNVTDMTAMFCSLKDSFYAFNGDLNNWDVSNVTTMESMFMGACGANPSISKWDVSNVKDMYQMFAWNQKFDDDISNWNVGNVRNMSLMFYESGFNGDLSKWDVSKVQDMHGMFSSSSFKGNNGSLNNWDVSNVTNMRGLFRSTFFNSDISNWDVSNVIHMGGIFYNSTFNKDISKWDINPVANTTDMFYRCDIIDEYKPKKLIKESFDFNSIDKEKKTINAYEKLPSILEKVTEYKLLSDEEYYILTSMVGVYKVKTTDKLKSIINYFIKLHGNKCDLNWIDTHDITNMSGLFFSYKFNGDISLWDVSNVTDMSIMFSGSGFNGDISNWNVSNVTNMKAMFWKSKFNSDISSWDVSNVIYARAMFMETEFNQDISNWHFNDNANTTDIFLACPIKDEYKPKMNKINESFDFSTINKKLHVNIYDKVFPIIEKIIKKGRITNISDAEYDLLIQYIGIYKPANKQELKNILSKFITYFGNNCNLNWIDVSDITNMDYLFNESFFDGDISLWDVSNVITMREMFGNSKFTGDISNWNVSNVIDMSSMFKQSIFNGDLSKWNVSNVINMEKTFIYSPFTGDISNWDVSNVINMTGLFWGSKFNGDISKWNVSNVTNMMYIFTESIFTGDISNWNVSNVTTLEGAFSSSKFNGDITRWDVSNVTNMEAMFFETEFNLDISSWDVSNVENMAYMFHTSMFNQDISNWDVKKVKKINDMFKNSKIQNEYKPKFNITEAFDFSSINDTRSKDALKTIEKLQHEQDFIDVPKIKGSELTKLKGFVAGMLKTDPEIHYTYTQDKDNVNGRILKIFTNNHVLHMFVKKYLALKNFLDTKGIELKIVPVCDQGKLNIWYTGQTELGIAPNEYQFDLDTNASILKGWKINNIILDGFVVSFWDTYDNKGGRSGEQLYQLAHNSLHVYLYNCSYSPNKKEMNKRVSNVLHHKLNHLKHSALHLKAAIGSINNGKDVDPLALKWLGEAFDFNALKDTKKTGILRTVDAYLEASFKTDIIAAKTTAVRKAIEGYIKSIKRYDRDNTLFFEYTEDDNILKIKMVNPNLELCFNTSPLIRLSSKMFNLGKSLPKMEIIHWKLGAKILNIHLNTGLSMEVIAAKGHSLTYYIEHGLYMLDLKHIAINNLILDRFVLNDEDISYLYDLNVKHIYTPKSRFTGVTKMINYKEFMNFPHISFTNNLGKTPKGLFMDEIEQESNYE